MIETIRFRVSKVQVDECVYFLEPVSRNVIYGNNEVHQVELRLGLEAVIDDPYLTPDGSDYQPDFRVAISAKMARAFVFEVFDLIDRDEPELVLHTNALVGGCWHLEGEAIRTIELAMIGGQPALVLTERRLEPIADAA